MTKGPHYRVTVHGGYGTTAAPLEAWQWSVNVEQDAIPIDNVLAQAIADAGYAAYLATNGLNSKVPSYAHTRAIDVRFIGAQGLQVKNATGQYIGVAQKAMLLNGGGSAAPVYPPQTALCVSLDTLRSGPSGKGRIFLPAPALALDSGTFLLAETAVEAVRDSVVAFINGVNTATAKDVNVMSSKGFASKVTSVRVGRVLDTMRSRRRDLLEKYSPSAPITT